MWTMASCMCVHANTHMRKVTQGQMYIDAGLYIEQEINFKSLKPVKYFI